MAPASEFPILEETWDMIDRSKIDVEHFRKVWLRCEAYLHSRGYTLVYPTSEAYRAIHANCSSVLRKAPQDPFHPQADEAFCFIDDRLPPLRDPIYAHSTLFPTPSVHMALDSRGRRVVLKAVHASSSELKITRLLSTDPLRADVWNHTIPLVEILEAGEWAIIVTPEWGFGHWEACVSVEEYIEFSRQLFEGLAFMHEKGIIHGASLDIHKLNVVTNQLERYRDSFHIFDPLPRDFGPCGANGLRFHYEAEAPEHLKDEPVDLFCCDVYALGAILKEHINDAKEREKKGIKSALLNAPQYEQVVENITHQDPQKRPTAAEALAQFEQLLQKR